MFRLFVENSLTQYADAYAGLGVDRLQWSLGR